MSDNVPMTGLLTDAPQVEANDLVIAKQMAEALHATYPGHLWAVSVDGGLCNVRNLALSGKWGFILKVPDIYSASSFKADIIRAGGELLERYRMPRGKMNFDKYDQLRVDFSGHFKPDT